jgi:hypothetical protein
MGADVVQDAPAVRAEALEAGELGLDRDARRAGRVDESAAVGGHVGQAGPQLGWIGIEPEDYLRLARCD